MRDVHTPKAPSDKLRCDLAVHQRRAHSNWELFNEIKAYFYWYILNTLRVPSAVYLIMAYIKRTPLHSLLVSFARSTLRMLRAVNKQQRQQSSTTNVFLLLNMKNNIFFPIFSQVTNICASQRNIKIEMK